MKDIKLTKDEEERLRGNDEEIRQLLINKAILHKAKQENYAEDEQKLIDYITKTEKAKYYLLTKVTPRVIIKEEEIKQIYDQNKDFFDEKKIEFNDETKKNIEYDLYNQKVSVEEGNVIKQFIDDMADPVELTKEDMQFSNGAADVIKTITINSIILKNAESTHFYDLEEEAAKNIEDNAVLNYYADKMVKDDIKVSQEDVEKFYNDKKEDFVNMPMDAAYNQIGNFLLNEQAAQLKMKLSDDIAKEYNVDELIKEYK